MKTRKTSFNVTESALVFENILLSHMDIPRTVFHRRMIDYFLKSNPTIHPKLLINRKAKNYIRRSKIEQIYLDEERENKLKEVAEKYNCSLGVVLFQALMVYSAAIAPTVLGEDTLNLLL